MDEDGCGLTDAEEPQDTPIEENAASSPLDHGCEQGPLQLASRRDQFTGGTSLVDYEEAPRKLPSYSNWVPRTVPRAVSRSCSTGSKPLSEGDEVFVKSHDMERARVRYIGPVDFANGTWVGVELSSGRGRHDGLFQGKRYFFCEPGAGIFVRQEAVIGVEEHLDGKDPLSEGNGSDAETATAETVTTDCDSQFASAILGAGARVARVPLGGELLPSTNKRVFDRLYQDHTRLRAKRSAQIQAQLERKKYEEEELLRMSSREGRPEEAFGASDRLYQDAELRRQRQAIRQQEMLDQEAMLQESWILYDEEAPPRWAQLYQNGMEAKIQRDLAHVEAQEERVREAQEKALPLTGDVNVAQVTDRLYEDATRRELERAAREAEKAEEEMCELHKQSVHRGKHVNVEAVVGRLYDQELERAELKRQAEAEAAHQAALRQARLRQSTPARFDHLYQDASRRNQAQRALREIHEKREEQKLQEQSVHAGIANKKWTQSDLKRVVESLSAGSSRNLTSVRGYRGPDGSGRLEVEKSPDPAPNEKPPAPEAPEVPPVPPQEPPNAKVAAQSARKQPPGAQKSPPIRQPQLGTGARSARPCLGARSTSALTGSSERPGGKGGQSLLAAAANSQNFGLPTSSSSSSSTAGAGAPAPMQPIYSDPQTAASQGQRRGQTLPGQRAAAAATAPGAATAARTAATSTTTATAATATNPPGSSARPGPRAHSPTGATSATAAVAARGLTNSRPQSPPRGLRGAARPAQPLTRTKSVPASALRPGGTHDSKAKPADCGRPRAPAAPARTAAAPPPPHPANFPARPRNCQLSEGSWGVLRDVYSLWMRQLPGMPTRDEVLCSFRHSLSNGQIFAMRPGFDKDAIINADELLRICVQAVVAGHSEDEMLEAVDLVTEVASMR